MSPSAPTSVTLSLSRWETYEICSAEADRSGWHTEVRSFVDYWLSITPPGRIPGRQHFDPIDIPRLLQRIWILDVLREPLRYRFRLAGSKKVEAMGREVTGLMFDEVHEPSAGREWALERLDAIASRGIATYRKGMAGLERDFKARYRVENVMLPLARNGTTVDMIAVYSVVATSLGKAL